MVSNRTDGFNPRDFIDFKWFQIEMKSFEINEIDFSCVSAFEINETISDGNWNQWNRDFIGRKLKNGEELEAEIWGIFK